MIKTSNIDIDSRTVFLLLIIVGATFLGGIFITKVSTGAAFFMIAALVISVASFLSAEVALYVLIISMLLSPEFIVGGIAGKAALGRGITLRFDDILLVIIGFSWFLKTAIKKELGLFLRTPLNRPIAYYLAVCLVATLFGFMMGRIKGLTGFFFVLKYFEYFIVYFMVVNHLPRISGGIYCHACAFNWHQYFHYSLDHGTILVLDRYNHYDSHNRG